MQLSILHCLKFLGSWSFQFGLDLRFLAVFFPDGAHTPVWVLSLEFLDPSFQSGQSVGSCFKGVQSFKTVALEFNFQNNFLSFAPKVRPDFCLRKGCLDCL